VICGDFEDLDALAVAVAGRQGRNLVMTLKPSLALATIATLTMSFTGAPMSQASPTDGSGSRADGVVLTTDEAGCTEISYFRAGLESAVRPLVPSRFKFNPVPQVEGQPARVALLINESTCTDVRTLGLSRDLTPKPVTTVIVSAPVTSGNLAGSYVLFHATQNRVQYNAFRSAGWSVDRLGQDVTTDLTRSADGSITGMALTVASGDWKHRIATTAPVTLQSPQPDSAAYYRDSPRGHLSLCFANNMSPVAPTRVAGDLTATPLVAVAATPPLFSDIPGNLSAGGWRSTLTTKSCPAG
jgi:hypothetical protein